LIVSWEFFLTWGFLLILASILVEVVGHLFFLKPGVKRSTAGALWCAHKEFRPAGAVLIWLGFALAIAGFIALLWPA
jgi:hypothetical protein